MTIFFTVNNQGEQREHRQKNHYLPKTHIPVANTAGTHPDQGKQETFF